MIRPPCFGLVESIPKSKPKLQQTTVFVYPNLPILLPKPPDRRLRPIAMKEFVRMNVVGIGTDIVECLRIARMIERHGELFINRVYTPQEIRYCQSRKQATQHFAGRWAAKEAILKALGTGWRRGISWRDIEVRNDPNGKPVVGLRGGARDLVEQLKISEFLISISHCRSHAVAYALALGPERDGSAPSK